MNIRFFLSLCLMGFLIGCSQPFAQGKRLYEFHCENCHQPEGDGLVKIMPPIANSDYYDANFDNLSCIIRYGLRDTILVNGTIYNGIMEGNSRLNEVEITNIINYMEYEFNDSKRRISVQEVESQLTNCK